MGAVGIPALERDWVTIKLPSPSSYIKFSSLPVLAYGTDDV